MLTVVQPDEFWCGASAVDRAQRGDQGRVLQDGPRDIGQLPVAAAGVPAERGEGGIDGDPVCLGDRALGLLDDDPAVERVVELLVHHLALAGGTVLAAKALRQIGPASSNTACKKNVVACVKAVAAQLGNTVAVCRSYYIHPALLEAYENEELLDALSLPEAMPEAWAWLDEEEQRVLAFLQARVS